MIKKSDPLANFRRSGSSDVVKTDSKAGVSVKEPYKAYQLSHDQKRFLKIRLPFPQPYEAPSNSMLTHIRGEWRMGLAITLEYGNTKMVKIEGEGLLELLEALHDWKVEWIQEFDPETHSTPEDNSAPVIKSITILPSGANPPPLDQRH